VYLIKPTDFNKRVTFGLEQLEKAFLEANYKVEYMDEAEYHSVVRPNAPSVYVADRTTNKWVIEREDAHELLYHTKAPEGEGFYIATLSGQRFVIVGGSDTGALYGCLELGDRVTKENELPRELFYGDAPVMKLRGPVLGLQLTKIEPPRNTYEYPITPDRFPWFYDKELWLEYLDMMVKERCNVLYIWSGHPFSSLVKLDKYPEALEVTEQEYLLNKDTFAWLTEECDKRGIWTVLKFYNIHIPYPFAVKHDLALLQTDIEPLVREYTIDCIIEFIKSYPNLGLMICLGEALRGQQNKTDWMLETLLPAVKEGLKQAGIDKEPPIILRAHSVDADTILTEGMKQYKNLYTMWKYNGESLTTYLPEGGWQDTHLELSAHGQPHIMNIHVLADLEPFRYGSPAFIQRSVQAGIHRLGGNGLHLYPMFYWDWPYAPDKVTPRLKAVERDWMWYSMWMRYAWNPYRAENEERLYWTEVFQKHFGCEQVAGEAILDAMEAAGECAPRILRRVGITEGNRQTLSLGQTLPQFTHVKKYKPNMELYKSVSTPGETIDEYINKEKDNLPHFGETPLDMVRETAYYAKRAMEKIQFAETFVTENKEEFGRFITDIKAIALMTESYGKKVKAAVNIMLYRNNMDEKLRGDLSILEDAERYLSESLVAYRELAALTEKTYLYANSMQTPQRKIPLPNGETYGHWTQCLPVYEKEYENFSKHLANMKNGIYPSDSQPDLSHLKPLKEAGFKILTEGYTKYKIEKGQSVFADSNNAIQACAPEVTGLTGIQIPRSEAEGNVGAKFEIEFEKDSYLLIGYFKIKSETNKWLKVPDLETDTHADDRGGLSVVFGEALKVDSCPSINVHAFKYEKGTHKIYFGQGNFAVIGVVDGDEKIVPRDAGLAGDLLESLGWMYEE